MVRGRTTLNARNSSPSPSLAVIPTGAKRSGGISSSRPGRFLDFLRSLRLRSGQAARNDEFISSGLRLPITEVGPGLTVQQNQLELPEHVSHWTAVGGVSPL